MPPAKILIVEDEPVLANAIRINLENAGHSVTGIYNAGEPALDHVQTDPPDLVIMDVTLQGKLDGVQTAERIHGFSNIPIIFITAHSDPKTVQRAISAGPYAYIVKPFQSRELLLNIELALQNRAAEQAILEQAERANTLARVASKVNRTLELNQVLDSVCDEVLATFDASGVAITLANEQTDQVLVLAARGTYGEIGDASPLPIPFALFEQLWETSGPVTQIMDLAAFRDVLPDSHPLLKDVKSVVIAFLVSGGRMIGSINIPSMSSPREYKESDLSLLGAIADLAAIAISHARLFEQVAEGRRRLQILSHQLVDVQEAERRHLANELHDQVGQMLTGLQFSLQAGRELPDQDVKSSLADSQEIVKEIISQVRELSLDLRPSLLDDMGLHACLEWHFDRYTRQTGIQVQFSEDGLGEKRFPADVEITVFRIIQEALTNIARHAKVREARVDFTVHENEILIRIEDQGKGFNVHTLEVEYASVGLGGMRERTNLVGGKLEIYSAPERGTLITAHIPTKKIIERRKHARNRNPG